MNEIRCGFVESVSGKKKTAVVRYPDKNKTSPPLKVIQRPTNVIVKETNITFGITSKKHNHETETVEWLPEVGDFVLCVIIAENGGGYILGKIER